MPSGSNSRCRRRTPVAGSVDLSGGHIAQMSNCPTRFPRVPRRGPRLHTAPHRRALPFAWSAFRVAQVHRGYPDAAFFASVVGRTVPACCLRVPRSRRTRPPRDVARGDRRRYAATHRGRPRGPDRRASARLSRRGRPRSRRARRHHARRPRVRRSPNAPTPSTSRGSLPSWPSSTACSTTRASGAPTTTCTRSDSASRTSATSVSSHAQQACRSTPTSVGGTSRASAASG